MTSELSWQQLIGIDESHLETICDSMDREVRVHHSLVDSVKRLLKRAEDAGLAMSIVSSYRSFDRQLAIWNEKWQGHRPVYSRHGRMLNILNLSDIERYKAICLWSAVPGLSRHHWGTDFDVFAVAPIKAGYQVQLVPEEFGLNGPCQELESWLDKELENLGFFRPYQEFQQGVAEEPWHISHIAIASTLHAEFPFEALRGHLENCDIRGKSCLLNQLDHYVEHYFNNICEVPS